MQDQDLKSFLIEELKTIAKIQKFPRFMNKHQAQQYVFGSRNDARWRKFEDVIQYYGFRYGSQQLWDRSIIDEKAHRWEAYCNEINDTKKYISKNL